MGSGLRKAAGFGLWGLVWGAIAVTFVAICRDTFWNGWDFEVVWRAARELMAGGRPYRVGYPDSEMIYKYPPWALLPALPLGWLELGNAKWFWGGVQCVSIVAVARWLRLEGISLGWIVGGSAAFWFLFAYHALAGQVMLPILALLVWVGTEGVARGSGDRGKGAARLRDERQRLRFWGPQSKREAIAFSLVTWLLSFKVFTLLALLGLGQALLRPRNWAAFTGVATLLTLGVVVLHADHSLVLLLSDWRETLASGGAKLGVGIAHGRNNQGLPAFAYRLLAIGPEHPQIETAIFVAIALPAAFLWLRASRTLPPSRRWAGWLALSIAVHPLAWFHSFVWVWPAAVFALADTARARRWGWHFVAWLGVACVCWLTREPFGATGAWLELQSIKGWGAMLTLVASSRGSLRNA